MLPLRQTITSDIMVPGSYWKLIVNVNGYKGFNNSELSTQAIAGRKFELLEKIDSYNSLPEIPTIKIRLLEDGYICWIKKRDLEKNSILINAWKPNLLTKKEILRRLPKVLMWIEKASMIKNFYLWGGTSGPNYDCSGLVQTAFASEDIWLPRDAYQQEKFCTSIKIQDDAFQELIPGDLLFFGNHEKCSHVGIYKGKNLYWHSSGIEHGHNGIGIDEFLPSNKSKVSIFYRSILRSVGRVEKCHDGTTLY